MKKNLILSLLSSVLLISQTSASPKRHDPPWLSKVKTDCVQRVTEQYGVTPDKVSLGKYRDDRKGLLNIARKVYKGAEGIKSFMCKFNVDDALIDVMSMTSDGSL